MAGGEIWNNLTDAFNKEMAIDEMNKKYNNTCLVLVKPTGEEILANYKGFAEGYHWFKDEFNVNLRLRHETEMQIVCKFPERRMFNHNNVALEFIRLPCRQYRRGICKDNVKIYSPVGAMWNAQGYHWTLATIRDALYPKYPTCIEEAVKPLITRDVLSVALDDRFSLTQNFTTDTHADKFFLFYSNVVIGTVKNNTVTIKHPLFKQEVLDNMGLFKPYNIEF